MPTYDIPSFQDFLDGESSTVRSKLNTNFDNAEAYLQGVEDRLEETESALHLDGVIWRRPGDVGDLIVSAGAGLSVNVTAGEALIGYRIQDTGHSNDGGNGITNGATNYCFLKQDGTLWFNTSGQPPAASRCILLATVTAAGGVITGANNYANGVVRGVGQPSLRAFTCTATEQVRDAVYISAANQVAQAISDDTLPAKARVVGIILAKESATSCLVATDGSLVGGYTGLTTGSAFYLATSAGALTATKPTAPDPIVPAGIAVSTTTMLVKIFVDEAQLGAGGGNLPGLTDVDDALAYTAGFVLRANGTIYTGQQLAVGDLSDAGTVVRTTGNQTIAGLKTFSTLPQSNVVPATGNDLVNKTYVDAFSQGLTPKEACRVASTANLTLSGEQTIDGVAVVAGDRVLVKNQTAGAENGIYVCAAGAWSRASDYDSSGEVQEGTFTYISQGTANGGKQFVQTTVDPVLGTSALVFVFLNQPTTYTASSGVKIVGTDIQADLSDTNPSLEIADGGLRAKVDDSSIQRAAGGLEIKAVSGALLTSLPSTPSAAGKLPTANLGSGTPDANKFLRGDQSWAVPAGIGAGVTALNYTKALVTATTETMIVNTSAEQTLYSYTVPGGTLGTDKILRLVIQGLYLNNSGGNKTLTVRMKYGGSTVTSKASGNIASNAATGYFCFIFWLGADGTTGGQVGFMECSCESGANASIDWNDRGAVAVDSTVGQALLITVQHSAASANLSIKTEIQHIELLNAQENVGSPIDATYVTIATDPNLTAERVLTGTANQIAITDNGPGAAVVLSAPQDLHDGALPTFGGLMLTGFEGILKAASGLVGTWGLGTDIIMKGTQASRPAAGVAGRLYYVTDGGSERWTRDNGTTWDDVGPDWDYVSGKPSSFPPSAHNTSHQAGGSDVVDADTVDSYHAAALEKTANKGAANGYASLDASAKVPTAQLTLPWIRQEVIVVVAGTLTASTTVPKVGYMKIPTDCTIEQVVCEVDTASAGASIIVDIHKIPVADIETDFTGTTIYTTQANRPTLAAGDRHVVAALPDITSIVQGDVLRVYCDQVGSTTAGSDLTVCLRVKQQAAWS